jgi:hypothetical protein
MVQFLSRRNGEPRPRSRRLWIPHRGNGEVAPWFVMETCPDEECPIAGWFLFGLLVFTISLLIYERFTEEKLGCSSQDIDFLEAELWRGGFM